MLRNYLKTAFRSMRRHRAYSFINVLGLSVGLMASFLILLWVQDERSYDQFPDEVEQIYRVMRTARHGAGQVSTTQAITAKLDEVLVQKYPEITMGALHSWEQNLVFARGDLKFRESGRHAGVDYFKLFSFPFLAGDRATALTDPNSVVLSETMARKYFGEAFAEGVSAQAAAASLLGEVLRLDNRLDVTVTGVIEDVPPNSSIQFDFVLPVEEYARRNSWMDNWTSSGIRMFVKLQPGADAAAVSGKIKNLIKEHAEESVSELFLQPYTDIYLRSKYENGVLVGGRIEYVRIFALVGLFILLIASINFMNLATARSAQRALEIGIRKTFGSSRRSLAGQFLGESILTALLALVIALLAVWLVLPGFNAVTNKQITLNLGDLTLWGQFLGLALVTGLLAGAYPAAYLSGISLIKVLRKGITSTARGVGLRKGLVVFQFAISIVLIVGTITVYNQMQYIRSKNLGMDRENVFYSRLEGAAANQYESFRAQLMQEPSIVGVTAGSDNPLEVNISTGGPRWDGKDPDDKTLYYVIMAGYDYLETMKMELVEGRTFSRAFATDSLNVVINETAARAMGMDDPIGQRLALWDREGQIIGVVKDFHMRSMYDPIEPLIFRLDPENVDLLFVRTAAGRTEEALAAFEKTFKAFNPEYPFEYQFLDTAFEETYRSEVVIGTLANYFALLAIFVACLGLFGLSSFTAERRTKEIGIRKVLGASVTHVVLLLSRDFVQLVVVAFVIGGPVAYWLMRDWLAEFTFHTDLGAGVFIVAAAAVLVMAFASIGYQSVKAALANPADSLRAE